METLPAWAIGLVFPFPPAAALSIVRAIHVALYDKEPSLVPQSSDYRVVGIFVLLERPSQAQEVVEYYATDAVGSIRVVFEASGTIRGRLDYAPFGKELFTAPALPAAQFGGQPKDGEVEQSYFNARNYQARTGRFTRVDPVYAGLFEPPGCKTHPAFCEADRQQGQASILGSLFSELFGDRGERSRTGRRGRGAVQTILARLLAVRRRRTRLLLRILCLTSCYPLVVDFSAPWRCTAAWGWSMVAKSAQYRHR